MVSGTSILIPNEVHQRISYWAEKAYPQEGCGLLIGEFESKDKKRVARFAPLSNELLTKNVNNAPTLPQHRQGEGSGRTEFVMNPQEFNQETVRAEKEGLDVIGIVHTHPDHPPKPSSIDASQPFLAGWSNIIVGVEKGKTKAMKSWFRESDGQPFIEEKIYVEE